MERVIVEPIEVRDDRVVRQVLTRAPQGRLIHVVVEPVVGLLVHVHPHDRLQVDAVPAAGALLANTVRPGGRNPVPVGVQPFDVLHLADALAVGRIAEPPVRQRIHVEVLSIEPESRQVHEPLDDVEKVAPALPAGRS